jgi:hypothetical protein
MDFVIKIYIYILTIYGFRTKKNILFLAGMDNHECIEIQRDTGDLVMIDKEVNVLEDCLVDIY